jgi:hypothetical protein
LNLLFNSGKKIEPQKDNHNRCAIELLKIEREYLLPALPKFECARLSDLRVDKYSTVTVNNFRKDFFELTVRKTFAKDAGF